MVYHSSKLQILQIKSSKIGSCYRQDPRTGKNVIEFRMRKRKTIQKYISQGLNTKIIFPFLIFV